MTWKQAHGYCFSLSVRDAGNGMVFFDNGGGRYKLLFIYFSTN